MFSTADWYWPYWTNKQHIASRIGARGFRVLYVESVGLRRPGLNATDLGRVGRRLQRAGRITITAENVWVLSPVTIPAAAGNKWIERLNVAHLVSRTSAWSRMQNVVSPVLWTYHPFMLEAASRLNHRALVYHAVDDLASLPWADSERFTAAERNLIATADLTFTTSPALRDRAEAIAPGRSDYFGNPADIDHFAAAREPGPEPADVAGIPRPRLGYSGVLSDFKIDFNLVAHIADSRPNLHWIFLGDEREGQRSKALAALATRSNIHFLGWRPYALLPSYYRAVDVAVLPQHLNRYTKSMFPMKFFEFLAAGKPVVAMPLPALAGFTHQHHRAGSAADMVRCIEEALTNPRVLPLSDPVLQAHSWESRIDSMLARIAALPQQRFSGR